MAPACVISADHLKLQQTRRFQVSVNERISVKKINKSKRHHMGKDTPLCKVVSWRDILMCKEVLNAVLEATM